MFKKILTSFLGVAIFFTLAEGICRIFDYPPYLSTEYFLLHIQGEILGQFDDKLFWRLPKVRPDFEEEDFRIICLSDSVSVMYGGNQEYPAMLEKFLNERLAPGRFRVFNAGVPGYTSYQGYLYLKNELIHYQPDLITINFGPNDRSYALNGKEDKEQKFKRSFLDDIFKWSRFYQAYRIWILKLNSLIQKVKLGVLKDEKVRVSIDDFRKNLESMIELSEQKGAKVILLTSPYLNRGQAWVERHRRYNQVIREVAEAEKVYLVDLAERFSQREDLFIEPEIDHVHINMDGYRLIAEALFDVIKEILRQEER